MGYTTDFEGKMTITPALEPQQVVFLNKLADTRRMARNVDESIYGVQGEFYIGKGFAGQDNELNIADYNQPPRTQPSLWLRWEISEDGTTLEWGGSEKFYAYTEWIEYLITKVFMPLDRQLDGTILYSGEETGDAGKIIVTSNKICVETWNEGTSFIEPKKNFDAKVLLKAIEAQVKIETETKFIVG
jgi:hypothetical protein